MPDNPLKGKIALVTGASRGIGAGVAIGLAEAGAKLYITARTLRKGQGPTRYSGSLTGTAQTVRRLGAKVVLIQCDHRDDRQVEDVFRTIDKKDGRLDLLVNSARSGYERLQDPDSTDNWRDSFWKIPLEIWDETHEVGVRSNYIASALTARKMVNQKSGLIVNISFFDGKKYLIGNIPYTVGKAAVDRMTKDMAIELKPHKVAAISLYPGFVAAKEVGGGISPVHRPRSCRPDFRSQDPAKIRKSPRAAALAREYGFTDVDGRLPPVHDLKSALK